MKIPSIAVLPQRFKNGAITSRQAFMFANQPSENTRHK
jgi:hypothetical protein